jgi:predicted Fe-Mo cluster-binding NifX family protein
MKIALPSRNNQIDDHFGHCAYFTVITFDEKKQIIQEETIQSPQGCGCKSNIASVLREQGVTTMLAGNIGGGAINVLGSHGIDVVRGCSGAVRSVAQQWAEGSLIDSGDVCHHHSDTCQH